LNIALLFGGLNRGGAELLSLQVIQNSKNRGINFLCIHRKGGVLLSDFSQTGAQVFKIAPKSPLDILYLFRLRKSLIHRKIRIIHTHQVIDSFIAIVSTVFTDIKTVQTFHGHGMNYSLKMRIMRWFALKFNTKNIFVSNSQLEYYKKKFRVYPARVTVIYNGIDTSKFCKFRGNSLRKELIVNKETIFTGTVGNFSGGRDQLTICHFLLLLANSKVNFKHIFIGGRSKTEPWLYDNCFSFCKENGLDKHVLFLGSRKDVPEILPQLDAFIYSTNHDTFSLALIEAIYSCIPVFTNDWRVFLELTKNGKLATIYKTKNEKDLLEKFLNFIENKEKYLQKAREASIIVNNNYSIESHLERLIQVYKEVIYKGYE
jgi:glycosyltransferase involved in cell wall biosynthesis